jgi:probable HAF family extracellular repeat protein
VNTRIAIAAAISASLLAVSAAEAQSLTAIDPSAGRAAGINLSGKIILDTHIADIYAPGVLTPLGTGDTVIWPHTPNGTAPMTRGAAINDSGVSVGQLVGDGAHRAADGTITNISTPVGIHSIAPNVPLAINNSGVMAGATYTSAGSQISFYGTPGAITGFGRPAGIPGPAPLFTVSRAYGINDAGIVAGYFVKDIPSTDNVPLSVAGKIAYLFNTNTSTWTELGVGIGYAINASNQVAGVKLEATSASMSADCGHAALFDAGTTTDLGTLGGTCSTALAISNDGKVVGSSQVAPGSTATHAFFYNGSLQDLNSLIPASDPLKATTTLTEARGINSSGQIVANGYDSSNPSQIRAYVVQLPRVSFQNGEADFGEVAVGSESDTQIIRVNNDDALDMNLGAITTTGDFSQTNSCGAVLMQHAYCAITVKFAPRTGGNHEGRLNVLVNGVPYSTSLGGSGTMQASLTTSTSNLVVGAPFTLTWTSTAGSTCVGLGPDHDTTQAGVTWADSKPASGAQDFIAPTAGTFVMSVRCTSNDQSVDSNEVAITATWPDVTISLTPSATSVISGNAVTLTWSSPAATSCASTGGGANDTWPNASRPNSGSASIVEPSAVSIPTALTFTLTCTSSGSGKTATAQAIVTLNPAPSSSGGGSGGSGGGSGAFDWLQLIFTAGVLAGVLARRRSQAARD